MTDHEPVSRQITTAAGELRDALVYKRSSLGRGDEVAGPAVIEDVEATTYLDPGDRATIAANGALVIEW